MRRVPIGTHVRVDFLVGLLAILAAPAMAQLIDRTTAPNAAGAGIAKSLADQIGAGRGDGRRRARRSSSSPATRSAPSGAAASSSSASSRARRATGRCSATARATSTGTWRIGAGLADSCAACHGRPRGSAGFGGDVVTRPDSRDAPHLFGLGLKEMLADEITADLRAIRAAALDAGRQAAAARSPGPLRSKGILRLDHRASRRHGGHVGSARGRRRPARAAVLRPRRHDLHPRVPGRGVQRGDGPAGRRTPSSPGAAAGGRIITPSGMVLDGSLDTIEAPPAGARVRRPRRRRREQRDPPSLVDHMEFYLLNYFKAGHGRADRPARRPGGRIFEHGSAAPPATCPTSPSSATAASPTSRRCSIPRAAIVQPAVRDRHGRFTATDDGSGFTRREAADSAGRSSSGTSSPTSSATTWARPSTSATTTAPSGRSS